MGGPALGCTYRQGVRAWMSPTGSGTGGGEAAATERLLRQKSARRCGLHAKDSRWAPKRKHSRAVLQVARTDWDQDDRV